MASSALIMSFLTFKLPDDFHQSEIGEFIFESIISSSPRSFSPSVRFSSSSFFSVFADFSVPFPPLPSNVLEIAVRNFESPM